MNKRKYILEVIFGEQANETLEVLSFDTVKRWINEGKIEGFCNKYHFETENDRNTALAMLVDSNGWNRYAARTEKDILHEKLTKALDGKTIYTAEEAIRSIIKETPELVDEKIDDSSTNDNEDDHVMMRSYQAGEYYIRIYFGRNSRLIGYIEVSST